MAKPAARNELLHEFARHAGQLGEAPAQQWLHEGSVMVTLAFSGSVDALAHLFQTRLEKLSHDTREFWLGTAELAAGSTTAGWTRLKNLRTRSKDELIRAEVSRRLEHAEALGWTPLSPASEAILRQIKQMDHTPVRAFGPQRSRLTAVVSIVIGLNLAMFIAELVFGGSTNPITLYRLGALDLYSVRFDGEYWRLLTSLFLHFGPLHLLFNLYALSIIGPGLETSDRGDSICDLLFVIRIGIEHRCAHFECGRFDPGGVSGWGIGLRDGLGRGLGWIVVPSPGNAGCRTKVKEHSPYRCSPNRVRSFDAANQHGGAYERPDHRGDFGVIDRTEKTANHLSGKLETVEIRN